MLAAIDAGSNTLRLLIGKVANGKIIPVLYLRRICRLAGGFSEENGLSTAARERTLFVFKEFAEICRQYDVQQVRAVGTAAFRQAVNGEAFADEIRKTTRLPLEIINGDAEAEHMTVGVLNAIEPLPAHALIVDIGGGSTEFVLCEGRNVVWSCSLPLGVVRLTEDYASASRRRKFIKETLTAMCLELSKICNRLSTGCSALSLIGTAGTVTTLAALDMQMAEYDWRRVNNYVLSLPRLQSWQARLLPLSSEARETLAGMEAGRGDLIITGMEILLRLMQQMHAKRVTVSDFGILEGLLLSLKTLP